MHTHTHTDSTHPHTLTTLSYLATEDEVGLNLYYVEVGGEQRQTTNGDLMVMLLMF